MMEINNTQACFVRLWLRLERTRLLLKGQWRRFCVRNVLKLWMGSQATDDFIWEVCHRASLVLEKDEDDEPIGGWDELPPPRRKPRHHRELLRAYVATRLGIGMRKIDLNALDKAYSEAFPKSTAINVNKKSKELRSKK